MEIAKDDLTEGEKIVEQYLNDELLTFTAQPKLEGLKGDSKMHRQPDFYIKNFDVYVEFLGKWNVSENHRKVYKEKMAVYKANNIPCVYLWPDNLG